MRSITGIVAAGKTSDLATVTRLRVSSDTSNMFEVFLLEAWQDDGTRHRATDGQVVNSLQATDWHSMDDGINSTSAIVLGSLPFAETTYGAAGVVCSHVRLGMTMTYDQHWIVYGPNDTVLWDHAFVMNSEFVTNDMTLWTLTFLHTGWVLSSVTMPGNPVTVANPSFETPLWDSVGSGTFTPTSWSITGPVYANCNANAQDFLWGRVNTRTGNQMLLVGVNGAVQQLVKGFSPYFTYRLTLDVINRHWSSNPIACLTVKVGGVIVIDNVPVADNTDYENTVAYLGDAPYRQTVTFRTSDAWQLVYIANTTPNTSDASFWLDNVRIE